MTSLAVGTVLENRYRIEHHLARGGMGSVYKGIDLRFNQPVAIKENFLQSEEYARQFQQEATILYRLHHMNLPRVIDHFSQDNHQYLVMDFIQGKTLWDFISERRGPLNEREAVGYLSQVCDAVHYLHSQEPPILHRDIKPDNIRVNEKGRAFLVDFGIAKVVAEDTRTMTGARGITPGFSPPEQYSGTGTQPASDVYALGATLYALLTAKNPPDSISRMTGTAKFKEPILLNDRLSPAVSQVIEKAMALKIEDRPATVVEWQTMLTKIQQQTISELDTTPTSLSVNEPPTFAETLPTQPEPAKAPTPKQVNKQSSTKPSFPWLTVLGGTAILLLLLLMGAGFLLSGLLDDEDGADNEAIVPTATQQAVTFTQEEATPTPIPTDAPIPTDTPIPTETPTAVVPPTETPTSVSDTASADTSQATDVTAPQIIAPIGIPIDATNRATFRWQSIDESVSGYGFEIEIWAEGSNPQTIWLAPHNIETLLISEGNGIYRVDIVVNNAADVQRGGDGNYFWRVNLVDLTDPVNKLSAEPSLITVTGVQNIPDDGIPPPNGDNDGDNRRPPPPGDGDDNRPPPPGGGGGGDGGGRGGGGGGGRGGGNN